MGDAMAIVEETKSADKKEIEAEEKEKMLKETNGTDGETIELKQQNDNLAKPAKVKVEDREVQPKFIPIGGIKMPGFFTRVSAEKETPKDEETAHPLDGKSDEKRHNIRRMLFTCPFTAILHRRNANSTANDSENNTQEQQPSKLFNLEAIRQPITNLLQKRQNKEVTLASVETLDDKVDNTDGMETIKLDEKDDVENGTVAMKLPWRERIRLKQFIIDDLVIAVVVFGLVLALVIGVVVALALSGPPSERPLRDGRFMLATTSCGEVEGIMSEDAYTYYGIPYALPPTGPRRFQYAHPINSLGHCWNGRLKTHNPVPPCIQLLGNGTIIGQEDCLTLDIVTPKVRYDSPLAVVVFIDTNTIAGGVGPTHLSPKYAHLKDVVFVKPNFRLGALGFLALKMLSQEQYPEVSGNYGLSDLLVALKWIKLNINHFGGDPTKVTIYGHRAGASLASVLTSIKASQNLYRAAWLVSGSGVFNGTTLQDAEKINEQFLSVSGCKNVECLRNLPAEKIVRSTPDTWLSSHTMELPIDSEKQHSWLVIDGDLIRQHMYDGWEEERKRHAPTLVFVTTQHAGHSELLQKKHLNWTEDDVLQVFNESVLSKAPELFNDFNKTYEGLAALITAVRLTCPLMYVARLRLDTHMVVINSIDGLSDVNADVTAILGTVNTPSPAHRRRVAAIQALFYSLVWDGQVAGSKLVTIEQDTLPTQSLPGCDTLIKNDFVPRYALID